MSVIIKPGIWGDYGVQWSAKFYQLLFASILPKTSKSLQIVKKIWLRIMYVRAQFLGYYLCFGDKAPSSICQLGWVR